jgi:hypothetical protein
MRDRKYNYAYGFGMFAAKTVNFETYLRMLANERGVCISNEVLEVVRDCSEALVNEVELASIEHAEQYGQ